MSTFTNITTKSKALSINLDEKFYGTFAEIGGGQEVARAFFQAGAASGTIAKTISAYDKNFSDKLYSSNSNERYVSESRLLKMLDTEFSELNNNLSNTDFCDKLFFAFADTVETLNFNKTNSGQGWFGVRFQLNKFDKPNTVVLHANFNENDGILQQYTIGILGVNLIYACLNYYERPNFFLQSLMDNLNRDRVEINMISMSGPQLDYVDNRLLSLQLVKNNMTDATVFDRWGKVCKPADFLYKKNVIVLRGSFRPITYIGFYMLKSSFGFAKQNPNFNVNNTLQLCEITLNNLLQEGDLDERDFLDRVDLLNGMGQNVMISNFKEFYKFSDYMAQFKIENIRIVLGANILCKIFQKEWYKSLKGGILQALGMLLPSNAQIYVYPFLDLTDNKIYSSENLVVDEDLVLLYKYLRENKKIVDIPKCTNEMKNINSKDVLEKIKNNDPHWETLVPKYISKNIKSKNLFGYKL